MTLHKKTLCLCLTSALLGSIPAANATNGIFLIGYGAKARAMGGAQIAMSDDAIDGTMNPAALSFGEERLDAGLMIFNPQRRAACCNALDGTDPEGEVSDIPYYFIPNFAMSMKINDDLSWGFGFLGYGGGGTDYSQNFFDLGDTGRLGIEYTLAVMSPSLAYKINETQSVGMSLLIGVQRFRAYGLQAFTRFSVSPENVHENGLDYSVGGGLRLGWQMHAMQDRLELGASYSSKIYMQKFGKYKGLFAEQGNMDVPGNVTLGVAYKPVDPLTVAFDVERVFYQSVRAIGNRTLPISASSDPNDPNKMGQDTGPGFGWKDQTIFKLGVEYMIDPTWTVRAGVNYGKQPIRNDTGGGEFEVNVLAPAVTEWHYTAGGQYNISANSEINAAVMYAPANAETQQIPANTDLPFVDQKIELEMRQFAIEFSYGYKF